MKFLDYPTEVGRGLVHYRGELDEKPAWSDGWVMFAGDPPDSDTYEITDFTCAIARADPGNMPEVFPICVAQSGGLFVVWFSDRRTICDYRWFLAARERFGRVRYFSDAAGNATSRGAHQLVLKHGDVRVALIARIKEEGVPADVDQAIQEWKDKRS